MTFWILAADLTALKIGRTHTVMLFRTQAEGRSFASEYNPLVPIEIGQKERRAAPVPEWSVPW